MQGDLSINQKKDNVPGEQIRNGWLDWWIKWKCGLTTKKPRNEGKVRNGNIQHPTFNIQHRKNIQFPSRCGFNHERHETHEGKKWKARMRMIHLQNAFANRE
jgi:hypothetical protein